MIEPRGETLRLDANGLSHRVLRYPGPGPAAIILPGITSTALTAEFMARELARGYDVYVPDLRGRGGTDVPGPGQYSLDHYASDVVALVAELGLTGPTIVGHSLGARIAAAYSARSDRDHADLVLIDPPLSGPGRAPYPTSRADFARQLDAAHRGTTANEVRAFYPGWPARELEIRAQELGSCDRVAVLETHERFHTEDFLPLWREIRAPAVLIHGAVSPVVTADGVHELRALNPEIPLISIPDAGHMVPWDNWPAFADALLTYLNIDRSDS